MNRELVKSVVREEISSLDLHSIVEEVIKEELRDLKISDLIMQSLTITNPQMSKLVLEALKRIDYLALMQDPIRQYLIENLPRLTEKVISKEIAETDLESELVEQVLDRG